ncbi:MAG: SprT family zinc-dependent metalloprotease, partial [Candidatus Omnitrophota bacterium]
IEYTLSRSSRRRTIGITVSKRLQVRVAAPRYVLLNDIHNFILGKADWIVNALNDMRRQQAALPQRPFRAGTTFFFLGTGYPLSVQPEDRKRPEIHFDGRQWRVILSAGTPGPLQAEIIKQQLMKWYRREAEEILGSRLFHFSRLTGLTPKRIAVRTHRRIWGNCHYRDRAIHLNWQLVFFPPAVIDYVIVHELSHLEVPNHSRKFWERVERILPDYKQHRQWLKVNASRLVVS